MTKGVFNIYKDTCERCGFISIFIISITCNTTAKRFGTVPPETSELLPNAINCAERTRRLLQFIADIQMCLSHTHLNKYRQRSSYLPVLRCVWRLGLESLIVRWEGRWRCPSCTHHRWYCIDTGAPAPKWIHKSLIWTFSTGVPRWLEGSHRCPAEGRTAVSATTQRNCNLSSLPCIKKRQPVLLHLANKTRLNVMIDVKLHTRDSLWIW